MDDPVDNRGSTETLRDHHSRQFQETLEAAGLTVETGEIEQWLRRFEASDHDQRNLDSFLDFLLDEGVIEPSEYRRVGVRGHIRFEWIDLEELPKSDSVYEQIGEIGSGGMGEVRLAYDRHLDRRVAIKLIKRKRVDEATYFRFLQEGQITSKLQHPNIVPIYGLYSEPDGSLSLAMKVVTGRDLTEVIRELAEASLRGDILPEDMRLNRRLDMFLRVCDAISYAHRRCVIHRDLKPSNIMVGEFNEIYVMDWGLAKLELDEDMQGGWTGQVQRLDQRSDSAETRDGQVLGTPLYMAPEQARGDVDELDEKTDQYALGAILYELVTLHHMFEPRNYEDLIHQVKRGQKRPLKHVDGATKVPDELTAIIDKATSLEKRRRYASVEDLAADIRAHLDNRETSALPDSPLQKLGRWMNNHREASLITVLAIVIAASAIAMWSLAAQNQTIRESELRTQQLSKLQTHVASRATAVDAQVTRMTTLAESLAYSAALLRNDDDVYKGPIYSNEDYADPENPPPGLRYAPDYEMKLSLDQPVYKLAPGVSFESQERRIRQMMPLADILRDALRNSAINSNPEMSDWEVIAEQGAPLKWGYVGFESGLFVSFPGKDGYPPEYDPRERPWYALGRDAPGAGRCGDPYVDLQGQGLLLPCVAAIRSGDELIGVAGVEMAFDKMVETLMRPDGPVEATFLVNADGNVLISSHLEGNEYVRGELREATDLRPFPYEKVRRAILANESGPVWVEDGSDRMVFMVSPLTTRPGTYVEQASWSELRDWK